MVRHVLFVQGAGAGTYEEWDRALVTSLETSLGAEYTVHYPRMPREENPRYAAWNAAIRREIDRWGEGTIVVGHSIGATILIHTIAMSSAQGLAGVHLIAAPFIGDGGWPSDEIQPRTDFSDALPSDLAVFLYHGTDDETVPIRHVELYARAIPRATVRKLEGRDHQLDGDLKEVALDIRAVEAGLDG